MGQHCAEQTCKQLDYLPSKCDACQLLFCQDHLPYDDHKCNSLYKKNVKVRKSQSSPLGEQTSS